MITFFVELLYRNSAFCCIEMLPHPVLDNFLFVVSNEIEDNYSGRKVYTSAKFESKNLSDIVESFYVRSIRVF